MGQSYDPVSLHPVPRGITRRGVVILVLVVLAGLAILGALLSSYEGEGRGTVDGGVSVDSAEVSGLIASVEPRSVDPRTGLATVHVSLYAVGDGIINADGRMVANTRVIAYTTAGPQEIKYLAGDTIGQFDASLSLAGDQADYPFDTYSGFLQILADTYSVGSDGTVSTVENIPVGMAGDGSVSGWHTTTKLETEMADAPIAYFSFDRTFATRTFAIVLLALSITVAMTSIVIGVLVGTNRRRMEATMLSFAAALLFALPVLRNNFPGSPPIGVSIDFYVYLWVIAGAVAGLLMLVIAWARQQRAQLIAANADRDATAQP